MYEIGNVQDRQRFLARFVSGPFNRLKILSEAVNSTSAVTRILLRKDLNHLEPKLKFFAQKLSNLGYALNSEQTDTTQAYHRGAWGEAKPLADG